MIKSFYKTLLPGLVAVVLLGSVAFSVNTPVASAQAMSQQQAAETIQGLQQQLMALIAQLTQILANLQTQTLQPNLTLDSACLVLDRNLQMGDRDIFTNGEVTKLQRFLADTLGLNRADYVTGYFGQSTRNLLSQFQSQHGLAASGWADERTITQIARYGDRDGCGPTKPYHGVNTIQITSPNGGEQWEVGTMNTITWSPYDPNSGINSAKDVTAYLIPEGKGETVRIIPSGKASIHWEGLVTWADYSDTGAKLATPGRYYIKIINNKTGAQDTGDAPFTLLPRSVDLKLNGSDGPITADVSQPVRASWSATNVSRCEIHNAYPDLSLQQQVGVVPLSGSRDVYLHPSTGPTLYCYRSDGSARYDSVQVNVQPSTAVAALKVISPSGGEQIDPNKEWQIKVNISGLKSLSIALYKNDQWLAWIMKDISTAGQPTNNFDWVHVHTPAARMFPELKNGSAAIYKIYATGQKADGGGYVDDKSDSPFSFSGTTPPDDPTVPVITRVEPSVLIPGKMATAYGTNITFNISLDIDGKSLGYVSYNTGKVEFTVPNLPSGDYGLRITNKTTGASHTRAVTVGATVAPVPTGSLFVTPCTPGLGKSTTDPKNSVICDQTVSWTTTWPLPNMNTSGIRVVITGDFPYASTEYIAGTLIGSPATFWVTTGTYKATLYNGTTKLDEKAFVITAPTAQTQRLDQMASVLEGLKTVLQTIGR